MLCYYMNLGCKVILWAKYTTGIASFTVQLNSKTDSTVHVVIPPLKSASASMKTVMALLPSCIDSPVIEFNV